MIGAVISGGIFGDHVSPISDTTIISSMASGCDHIEHVRTQMPYALIVAGVTSVLYLFMGLIMV
ncbi:Na+/H+ antiporter [hydrothermal vent metagenome]|uniref:Na+/H+ antiporter n=1 Tax=hydrothermal vent metagenome TaxID=652676 RepID=A0A1W1BGH4_9ZZZZ